MNFVQYCRWVAKEEDRARVENPPMPHLVSKYWLTDTRGGKNKRYPSGWKMSPAEAASRGLTDADIVPGSTEERRDMGMQSAGLSGVRPNRSNDE